MSTETLRARLEAATPGPWKMGYTSDVLRWNTILASDDAHVTLRQDWLIDTPEIARLPLPPSWRHGTEDQETRGRAFEQQSDRNALLIAHAPTDLAALLEVVEAARRIGYNYKAGGTFGFDELQAALDAFEALP